MLAALSPAKLMGGLGVLTDPRQRSYALMQFKAWWDGDDFDADAANTILDEKFAAREADDAEEDAESGEADVWKPKLQDMNNRLRVSELLWGEGYVGPGDLEWHQQLAQTLTITDEKSLAMIGGGLAGPAREMSEELDVWTTVYERIPDVATAATQQNETKSGGKKVAVETFDPLTIDLPKDKYHALVCLFEGHRIPDKPALIAAGAAAIQKTSPFLFVDYVTGDGDTNIKDAFMGYWGPTELWSEDQYKEEIEKNNINIRVNEDVTEPVLGYIAAAWAEWEKVVKKIDTFDIDDEERTALVRILKEEAEMWAARQAAMKARTLRVVRLFGLKK